MRRRLESLGDKKDVIKCAMECMQSEIDRITNDHNDHLKKLFESHNAQISETKKKQWVRETNSWLIFIMFSFSVTTVNKRLFIIVAGTQRIVHKVASNNIGKLNIKKYADVNVKSFTKKYTKYVMLFCVLYIFIVC